MLPHPPPLNSSELQAICDTIVSNQDKYTKKQTVADSTFTAFGLSPQSTPNDLFLKIKELENRTTIISSVFIGNGQNTVRINLSAGFQAQAIFIMPQMYSQTVGSSNYIQWNVAFFADIGSNIGVFSCVQSQQTIYIITNTQYGYIPNNNGVVYNYVAIGYKS